MGLDDRIGLSAAEPGERVKPKTRKLRNQWMANRKAVAESLRIANAVLIKHQVKLPSGATLTVCAPSTERVSA
jgi:hypothetical protein